MPPVAGEEKGVEARTLALCPGGAVSQHPLMDMGIKRYE